MQIVDKWHPALLFSALSEIDREAEQERSALDYRKAATALLVMALCLFLIHYLKYEYVFIGALRTLDSWNSGQSGLYQAMLQSDWFRLSTQVWWTGWHLIGYVIIPICIIRFVWGEKVILYGTGFGETNRYIPYYVALAAPIVFFAFLVSFRDDFSSHYPFYQLASRSIVDLLLWEFLYVIQFIALEFFFRGFVLHACKPSFGASAIFVMCVPYLMIHFPKPWLEAFGAIPFGILLGILALRSRSIWGGAAVHATIAISMDLLALMQGGKLPGNWLPTY